MKILVFSDNHGDLDIMEKIILEEPHDLLIHAGDFTMDKSLISTRFDHWVDGNNDFPHDKPIEYFHIFNYTFCLQHGHMLPLDNMQKVARKMKKKNIDVLIFGHTHVPYNEKINGVQLFNPGSCRLPRSDSGKTYGIINIINNKLTFKIKKIK